MEPLQQGDVTLKPIESIPSGVKKVEVMKRKKGKIILAEGETTGHAHAISDPGAYLILLDDGNMLLDVTSNKVTVYHETHRPIEVPKGKYLVGRVLEFDHVQGSSRYVLD